MVQPNSNSSNDGSCSMRLTHDLKAGPASDFFTASFSLSLAGRWENRRHPISQVGQEKLWPVTKGTAPQLPPCLRPGSYSVPSEKSSQIFFLDQAEPVSPSPVWVRQPAGCGGGAGAASEAHRKGPASPEAQRAQQRPCEQSPVLG